VRANRSIDEPIDQKTKVRDEDGDSWDVARRGAVRRVETM
jgi:hypothetical protein